MVPSLFFHAALLTSLITSTVATGEPPPGKDGAHTNHRPAYLCSFFREPDGKWGLHLAASRDGLRWTEIGPPSHTWLKPSLGSKAMRDPCLRQAPDGLFHMVWTTGWWDKGFGYASSRDLIHWSDQVWVPVNEKTVGAKNTWAPELFYDRAQRKWLAIWATTIEGRFPETAAHNDQNHRLYYTTTTDFKRFSETRLFYDPGFNCIDGTVLEANGRFYLILKNETPGHRSLQICEGKTPEGPWGPASPPLPKPGLKVEGPSALRIGDTYWIYFDAYFDEKYSAITSKDLKTWTGINGQLFFPKGIRHATMIEVDPAVLTQLEKAVAETQRPTRSKVLSK